MLSRGADPNSKDGLGTPVLDLAAAKATSKFVRQLLVAGANVTATDTNGGSSPARRANTFECLRQISDPPKNRCR